MEVLLENRWTQIKLIYYQLRIYLLYLPHLSRYVQDHRRQIVPVQQTKLVLDQRQTQYVLTYPLHCLPHPLIQTPQPPVHPVLQDFVVHYPAAQLEFQCLQNFGLHFQDLG